VASSGTKNGLAVGSIGIGAVLVWSSIYNEPVLSTVRDLIQGNAPTAGPGQWGAQPGEVFEQGPSLNSTSPGSLGSGPNGTSNTLSSRGNPLGASEQANQRLGQQMAAAYGWASGNEWIALNNVVMQESGWNAFAANPTSDARGIAQNINGWSADYQEGNAPQQIAWLLSYIKERYGDPIAAWQHELADHWY
jgi:hypothetical protein